MITPENLTRRLERFYALTLLSLGRGLDADEAEELGQLKYTLREYLERTTPEFFKK